MKDNLRARAARRTALMRLVWLLPLAAAALVGALAYQIEAKRALTTTRELDYGEGLVMWQATRVFDLREAYRDINRAPYMVFHYMPLYHVAARYAGMAEGDLLKGGRLVSELCGALVALIVMAWVWLAIPRRAGPVPRWGAVLAAAAFYFGTRNLLWMHVMRVDAMAVFFAFSGLFLYFLGRRRPALCYAAMLPFVLAVFTKQTMVAAPAACLIAEWLANRGRAVRVAILAIVLGSGGLAYLWVSTSGTAFRHLFLYNQNPAAINNLIVQTWLNLSWSGLQIVCAGGLAWYTLTRPMSRAGARLRSSDWFRAAFVASLHFCTSFLIGLGVIKEGATANYFLEWNIVCCVLGGMAVGRALMRPRTTRFPAPETAALLLAPCLAVAAGLEFETFRPAPPPDDPDTAAVRALVRQTPGPVYSDAMLLLLQAGKDLWAEPAIVSSLARTGTWNERPLVEWMREGRFDLIVTAAGLDSKAMFTPGVRRAVLERYELAMRRGPFTVYKRKGEPLPGRAASQPCDCAVQSAPPRASCAAPPSSPSRALPVLSSAPDNVEGPGRSVFLRHYEQWSQYVSQDTGHRRRRVHRQPRNG